MTLQQTKEALARYKRRLDVALNNLRVAQEAVYSARENVARMQTDIRSIRARKRRKAHSWKCARGEGGKRRWEQDEAKLTKCGGP